MEGARAGGLYDARGMCSASPMRRVPTSAVPRCACARSAAPTGTRGDTWLAWAAEAVPVRCAAVAARAGASGGLHGSVRMCVAVRSWVS